METDRRVLKGAALLAALLVVLSGCLSGGSPAVAPGMGHIDESHLADPLLGANGTLLGAVLNTNGVPLKGARVTVLGHSLFADTDPEGGFTFGPIAPGLYTLRADRKGYTSVEDTVSVAASAITRATITLASDDGRSVGFLEHAHDFWGDAPERLLLKDTVRQKDSMLNGGSGTPHACAALSGSYAPGARSDSGACFVLPFRLPDRQIVPPGTKELRVTITWGATDQVRTVDLRYAAANSTAIKVLTFEPGQPRTIAVNEGMHDHGHALYTLWRFEIHQVPQVAGVVVATDETNRRNVGNYEVEIVAVKGTVLPEPAHARFWASGGKLVLLERGQLNITGAPIPRARDPTATICGGVPCFVLPPTVLVPPGTTRLDATLEWAHGNDAYNALSAQKSLAIRAAKSNPAWATWDDLRIEEGRYDGMKVTYSLAVQPEEADAFYQKKSAWLFHVAKRGEETAEDYQPECPYAGCGGDAFLLHVEAVNENWEADRAAGRV